MHPDILSFDCWINGDQVHSIFPVEISATKTVGALKTAIWEEIFHTPCSNADARAMELYSLAGQDPEARLQEWFPEKAVKLSGRVKLSALLPLADLIIVICGLKAPASTKSPAVDIPDTTLNCWVRGHGTKTVFSVDISSLKTIATLKDAIKDKKPAEFRDVDANNLALYKVSVPYNDVVENALNLLSLNQHVLLHPLDTISDVFFDAPLPKHLHIVVEVPPPTRLRTHIQSSIPSLQLHGLEAQRRGFLQNNPILAPSSGATLPSFTTRQQNEKSAIYCNRPHTACATTPATLRHPVFGEFLDDCKRNPTTADDNAFAEELRIAMSGLYPDERDRAATIRDVFRKRDIDLTITAIGDRFPTDGSMSHNGHFYVLCEFKNEVGSTGADPYSQACLYYLESTRRYAERRWYSPLPCIVLLLFGPYVAFVAATWDSRPVVQPVSTVLPMHYHPVDTDMQINVARHLVAFKKAVAKLAEYYQSPGFNDPPPPPHQSLFPHPTSFTSLQEKRQRTFVYESQPFPDKLLFFGSLGDRSVCLKFVRRYSKVTHQECATLGYAPVLLGFEEIPGGWFMVVMDRLVDREWECPAISNRVLSPSLVSNIRNVVAQLHQKGHVHGDIRTANVMVSRSDETKFMLVDFDWAGKIGEAEYPTNVNRGPELWRPKGVVDGALILADHDLDMLDRIKKEHCRADMGRTTPSTYLSQLRSL